MHKTDTHVRFGNGRGSEAKPVLVTGFASDVIKQIKNIIIRRKFDASARHPMVHASPYTESAVTA